MLFLLGEVRARCFLELGCRVGLGYDMGRGIEYRKGAGNENLKEERDEGRKNGGGGRDELTRRVAALRRMPTTVEGDAVPEAALSAAYTSDKTD